MKTSTAIVYSLVLLALVLFVHTMDFREMSLQEANKLESAIVSAPTDYMLREHREAKFYTPFGQADCRPPRAENEFRVYVEWCADGKTCYRSCSIETRDPNSSRAAVKKRALQKS